MNHLACIVSCGVGLELIGEGKHKVTAVAVDDATQQGALVGGGGSSNKRTRVDVHGSGTDGFRINSSKNTLKDTSSTDNAGDGYSVTGDRTKLSRCAATGNGDDGFDLVGNQTKLDASLSAANGDRNVIKNVRAVSNSGHGVRLTSGAMDVKVSKVIALDNLGEDLADDDAGCGSNDWSKNIFGSSDSDGVASLACIE